MASTYSASLRLELMATGDQSGTWGDTTNTNLGTLLEQAITGFLSVAQGDVANLTLTALDGASDQSRNAVIDLTGALTAARNVVVPTAEKVYLIKNSTTGGFSIVVKTAAGSGVTVPPGTARWVYCDGTNVVDGLTGNQAANAFLAGYTTTATAAGTTVLTVASTQTQYFTGVTTQTITLPVTSTLVLGQEYEIVNNSTGSLTVNSSGGNLVATVLAGNTVRVQVILTSGTSAASWNSIAASIPNPLTLSGSSVGYTPLVLTSTQADAAAGPILNLYRDSATPAANDILAQLLWNGEDSAGNTQEYASVQAVIVSATSTTEASTLDFYTQKGGARVLGLSIAGPVANAPSFAAGYTTTATAAGTTTLTVSSNQQQYFTGTTTQTVVLPVTSTLVLGQSYRIVNNSTGAVTVQSSGANAIIVVAPGTQVQLTCILTSGTTAASWDSKVVGGVISGAPTASTSGTSISFTGLPPGVKWVDFMFAGLSTNGTSTPMIQIGGSGGYDATGYAGSTSYTSGATANYSTGFLIASATAAAHVYNGTARLTLLNSTTGQWLFTVVNGMSDSANNQYGGGAKTLSAGPLERVQITTTNGTDAFDAGAVNLIYGL
jgi:hypothetical protein